MGPEGSSARRIAVLLSDWEEPSRNKDHQMSRPSREWLAHPSVRSVEAPPHARNGASADLRAVGVNIDRVSPIYLSPEEPRWSPRNEDDLQAAIDGGLLEETHYLELKREIPPGKGSNKESARDMAQFAVDGGIIIVGLEEIDGAAPRLSPVDLDGLSERVEQIARTTVDAPLTVSTTAIPSAVDPTKGYLVIQIPASGRAPHMVDGTYFGRGDKVKVRLSDPEVRRLHASQREMENVSRDALAAYVGRDPIPDHRRQQAHLFIVAVPLTPRHEMLVNLTSSDDAHSQLLAILNAAKASPDPRTGSSFSPHLGLAGSFSRRPDGAAMAAGLDPTRSATRLQDGYFDENAIEVEFSEDGEIRLMTMRLSDEIHEQQQLSPTMMPVLTRQLVELAGLVCSKVGYGGMWAFGVAAQGIRNMLIHDNERWFGDRRTGDRDSYEQHSTASTVEILQSPGSVTQRLVGKFVRGMGLERLEEVQKSFGLQPD